MKGNRFVRVIFGLLVLALFSFYSYKRYETSPKSNDFDSEHAYIYSEVLKKLKSGELEDKNKMVVAPAEPAVQEAAPLPTETPAPEPAETPEPTELQSGLPNVDLAGWELVLVNADNPLPAEFAPATVNVSDSQCPVDARIQPYLEAFLQGCRDAGLPVYLSSGYRSYDEQNYLFQRKLGQGYTYEGASTIVAPPGTSEHQTGLACDITDVYRESKSWETLEPTATFQWLNEHCAEYGFILRYPKDKSGLYYDGSALQTVTGIVYEPWHFRYVGVEAAQYIKDNGLCLEEFVELYA